MTSASPPREAERIGFFSQALRFGLVGIGGAVVDFGSLQLILAAGVWPNLARVLSFTIGSTAVYLVNRRWTFTARRDFREKAALTTVLAITFVLVGVTNALARQLLPDSSWQITLAWAVSQAIATAFNFVAQRTFVFRRRDPDRENDHPNPASR
ncbi:MAG: GtrA family protein [Saccharopolyspora sp.]|uniref:GtrA family protein n=1 Tax=Saccharopolyspora TaxID=1835 RepID=UPI00190A9F15|nr:MULTISPECIES: GtrA family protein [unclassified Saccharopolyspora]MBK0865194.1 GtrA family protein [Saccharopolyspora sp. HNM0986]MBQ6644522.1 GtrA family protein [Saccharopolyspora sp.]